MEDSLRGLETAATPIIGPPSVPSYGGGSLLDSILLPNQSCPTSGSSSRCQTIRPVGGRLYTNNLSNNNSQSLPSGQTMSWGGSGGDGFGFRARTPPPQMSSQFSLSPVHGENSCFKPIQSHPLSSGANAGNGSSQQYFNFNTSPSTRMSGFITPPPHSTTPTSSPGSASSSPLSKVTHSSAQVTLDPVLIVVSLSFRPVTPDRSTLLCAHHFRIITALLPPITALIPELLTLDFVVSLRIEVAQV